jgi:tetratricopeptide (TPR) repeat protein
LYRPVIARILFCLGKFELAAKKYDKAGSDRYFFSDSSGFWHEDYQWEISLCTALCYNLGGDFQQAVSVLEQLGSSEHHAEGSAWWIAKWYTERGEYDHAAQYLQRELDLRYSPPASWELSTILTLSKVAGEQGNVQKFSEWLARNNPEMQVLLIGISEQLWPPIAKLSPESRDHWIHAAFELHSLKQLPANQTCKRLSRSREPSDPGIR